jgi:hypothetical protein
MPGAWRGVVASGMRTVCSLMSAVDVYHSDNPEAWVAHIEVSSRVSHHPGPAGPPFHHTVEKPRKKSLTWPSTAGNVFLSRPPFHWSLSIAPPLLVT